MLACKESTPFSHLMTQMMGNLLCWDTTISGPGFMGYPGRGRYWWRGHIAFNDLSQKVIHIISPKANWSELLSWSKLNAKVSEKYERTHGKFCNHFYICQYLKLLNRSPKIYGSLIIKSGIILSSTYQAITYVKIYYLQYENLIPKAVQTYNPLKWAILSQFYRWKTYRKKQFLASIGVEF